jgi:hypothetical protein
VSSGCPKQTGESSRDRSTDPSSTEARDNALIIYLKSKHAANMFSRIGDLAKQALDNDSEFEPSKKEFVNLFKWLMGVSTYARPYI